MFKNGIAQIKTWKFPELISWTSYHNEANSQSRPVLSVRDFGVFKWGYKKIKGRISPAMMLKIIDG